MQQSTEIIAVLKQTLSDQQGRYILENHQDAVSEFSLERRLEQQVKFFTIDRSFIDSDGMRWIVDYKTTTHQGAGRDDFLLQQKEIYREQLENYASLFAKIETRPIKLVLYFTQYQKQISWDWQNPSLNS